MRALETVVGTVAAVLVTFAGANVSHAEDPWTDSTGQCPESIKGVTVTTKEVGGGVTVSLVRPTVEHVDELCDQVRHVSTLVERHSKVASTDPMVAANPDALVIPPVTIRVKNIGKGAVVTIQAEKPGDVAEVRQLAEGFEHVWEQSDCVKAAPETMSGLPSTGPAAITWPEL
jgi:hypothetical protein